MTPSTTRGVTCLSVSAPPVSIDHCCVNPLAFDVLIRSSGEKRLLWRSKLCDDQSPDVPPCARVGATNQVPMPARLTAVATAVNRLDHASLNLMGNTPLGRWGIP